MDAAPPRPATPGRLRRVGVILGVWAAVAGGALLAAQALDSPVGAGARDEARPVAPDTVADPASGGLAEGLPPLTLVLDRPLPSAIASLPPIRQAVRLERLATRSGSARRYVELGSVLQTLGDLAGATAAYRSALRAGGQEPAAETGLALLQAADGPDGPARAAARLDRLAASAPRDQLIAFNQGWLAIYRRQADPARAAWRRVIALGPDTRLGRVAGALLASLEARDPGRDP